MAIENLKNLFKGVDLPNMENMEPSHNTLSSNNYSTSSYGNMTEEDEVFDYPVDVRYNPKDCKRVSFHVVR